MAALLISMGKTSTSAQEGRCPRVSQTWYEEHLRCAADCLTLDNGLVCAPADVHLKVLEMVQQVLDDYGPIPWSKESSLPS